LVDGFFTQPGELQTQLSPGKKTTGIVV